MLMRTASPITPGKGIIGWNLQWDVSPEWGITLYHWIRGNY